MHSLKTTETFPAAGYISSNSAPIRNVGVFIDMENLFGGYAGDVDGVPVRRMVKEIRAVSQSCGVLSEISIMRAYANWADPRLHVYRRELMETGIEPIQVFAFGQQVKNAADIELVVDAMAIAAESSHIDVFVIVSGDGGFVPLVRKLHALGKFVVVVSTKSPNKLLRASADHTHVVHTEADQDQKKPAKPRPTKKRTSKQKPKPDSAESKPRVSRQEGPESFPSYSSVPSNRSGLHEAVKTITADASFRSWFDREGSGENGVLMSNVLIAMRRMNSEFPSKLSTFFPSAKFGFLFCLAETEYGLTHEPGSPVEIVRRTGGGAILQDICEADLASTPVVLEVLERCTPPIRIVDPTLFLDVVDVVWELQFGEVTFAVLIDEIADQLEEWPAEDVRRTLTGLRTLGILESLDVQDPPLPLPEQRVSLVEDLASPDDCVELAIARIIEALDEYEWPTPHELFSRLDERSMHDGDDLYESRWQLDHTETAMTNQPVECVPQARPTTSKG